MSKVITFSRNFQKSHPRAGEPTYFVEKIWKGLEYDIEDDSFTDLIYEYNNAWFTQSLFESCNYGMFAPKFHTIRQGHRFKEGYLFSPRVWSGKPYASKQIIIAPDIEVKKTWDFECYEDGTFYIELKNTPGISSKWIDVTSCDLPQNDGLSIDDFLAWFPVGKHFSGQIICWNEEIEY